MIKILILYLLYFVKDASLNRACEAENKYDWSYHGTENGPDKWADLYKDCGKDNQSPTDIEPQEFLAGYPPIILNNFDKPITEAKVSNLGWTVAITPSDGVDRHITFGAQKYEMYNIFFHFGPKDDPGAEHMINGSKYTMEMQVLLVSEDKKVTSYFSTLLNVDSEDNPALSPIVDALPDVMYRGDVTDLQSNLNLNAILPEMTGEYYPYYGYIAKNSLPPCQNGYLFFILKDTVTVGSDQLDSFMTLYSVEEEDASEDCLMGPNHRPVQPFDYRWSFYGPWFLNPSEG